MSLRVHIALNGESKKNSSKEHLPEPKHYCHLVLFQFKCPFLHTYHTVKKEIQMGRGLLIKKVTISVSEKTFLKSMCPFKGVIQN